MVPEVGGGAETRAAGDRLHRLVRGLQQLLREPHPLLQQPLQRCDAEPLLEPPGEGTLAQAGDAGELRDGQLLVQSLLCPVEDRCQFVAPLRAGHRPGVLGLAALAVRGHDHPPGHLVRDGGAVVLAYQVQTEVDGRAGAGRGEDVPLVGVEGGGGEVDVGEAVGEVSGVHPVRRRRTAGEQARGGEHVGARADRDDALAPLVRLAQHLHEVGRRGELSGPCEGGDEDRVGVEQIVESVRGVDPQTGRCPQRARGVPAHPEFVPGVHDVGTVRPEHFAGNRQFECGGGIRDRDGDYMGTHVGNLAQDGETADGRPMAERRSFRP
ncbi:hypothetical protein GCM10010272_51770 [Streptomyces lateritius]|nr:hypothetical protein GCM10010272_51770 [Streptomyces lateritius]